MNEKEQIKDLQAESPSVSSDSYREEGKRIAIFGSTGSIGTQALDVIAAHPDRFSVEILTAQTNDELLVHQALKFNPNIIVIGDEKRYGKVKAALASTAIKVFAGEKALEEVAAMFGDHDLVIVYQKELDSAEVPLESIEEIIPGLGGKRSPPDEMSEKGGVRGEVVESEGISV